MFGSLAHAEVIPNKNWAARGEQVDEREIQSSGLNYRQFRKLGGIGGIQIFAFFFPQCQLLRMVMHTPTKISYGYLMAQAGFFCFLDPGLIY